MAKENCSHRVNEVNDGSPSRIRMVLRISLGMTTRPRSSMRRTIPVAFIWHSLLIYIADTDVIVAHGWEIIHKGRRMRKKERFWWGGCGRVMLCKEYFSRVCGDVNEIFHGWLFFRDSHELDNFYLLVVSAVGV